MPQYIEANRQLTLQGHIVYTVATISTSDATKKSDITEEDKQVLDLVHLRKIQESDAVLLITDETGYIGFSTFREIQWAQMNGIRIYQRIKDVGSCFHELWDPRKENFNG
jgi:hypothetical protein